MGRPQVPRLSGLKSANIAISSSLDELRCQWIQNHGAVINPIGQHSPFAALQAHGLPFFGRIHIQSAAIYGTGVNTFWSGRSSLNARKVEDAFEHRTDGGRVGLERVLHL